MVIQAKAKKTKASVIDKVLSYFAEKKVQAAAEIYCETLVQVIERMLKPMPQALGKAANVIAANPQRLEEIKATIELLVTQLKPYVKEFKPVMAGYLKDVAAENKAIEKIGEKLIDEWTKIFK